MCAKSIQKAIEGKIHTIRGVQVMLDRDLAELYGVTTKSLNQAVKRNAERFPKDFMFQVTSEEFASLRSQNVTSKTSKGGRRYLPYVFTEHGILMLSSVLNSDRAIQVNISIMRIFVYLREMIGAHRELALKLNQLEQKVSRHDNDIKTIFQAIRQLIMVPEKPKRKIGFHLQK